jgi:hypothetical protein
MKKPDSNLRPSRALPPLGYFASTTRLASFEAQAIPHLDALTIVLSRLHFEHFFVIGID